MYFLSKLLRLIPKCFYPGSDANWCHALISQHFSMTIASRNRPNSANLPATLQLSYDVLTNSLCELSRIWSARANARTLRANGNVRVLTLDIKRARRATLVCPLCAHETHTCARSGCAKGLVNLTFSYVSARTHAETHSHTEKHRRRACNFRALDNPPDHQTK